MPSQMKGTRRNLDNALDETKAEDEEPEYEVEKIVEEKKEKGRSKFLIKWKGCEDLTWEPESNLTNSKDLIDAFHRKNAKVTQKMRNRTKANMKANMETDVECDENLWEVEAIVGEKVEGEVQYFHVKWEGHTELTWEPEENMVNAKGKINEFRRKKKKQEQEDRQKQQKEQDKSEEEEKEADEYVVEKIVEMKVQAGKKTFLIQWEGYKEKTWEPESNLTADAVRLFEEERVKKAVCFFCNEADGAVRRYCETCGKTMHHCCAIVANENIPESIDKCYCSKACYNGEPQGNQKRKRNQNQKPLENDESHSDKEYGDSEEENEAPTKKKTTTKNKKTAVVADAETKTVQSPTSRNEKNSADFQFYLKHVAFPLATDGVWMAPQKEDQRKLAALSEIRSLTGIIKSRREKQVRKTKTKKDEETKSSEGSNEKQKKAPRVFEYEVNRTTTRFQASSLIRFIPESKVIEGISRYQQLMRAHVLQWQNLQVAPHNERVHLDVNPDDLEEYDGPLPDALYEEYAYELSNHEDVERVEGLQFHVDQGNVTPSDLFKRADGSTETRIKESSRKIFLHSASSSFFAYLPRAFWLEVVAETNKYAKDKKDTAITMDEMMKFLGIMFFMAVQNKGEMSNYWGKQLEDDLLGVHSLSLDQYMSFRRFKFIRSNLCFNYDVTPENLKSDPVARIRPLIGVLKVQSQKHVDVGRNVSVDEASIACRSKYARGLIVYNATKPTGKYHFKMYVCACATTWLAYSFKLHCSAEMKARLQGTMSTHVGEQFEKDLQYSAEVRKHVLEVTQPFYKSNRIVNTDNFYTSAALLMSLRTVGLYGRGTVRKNSKHFPSFVVLPKDKDIPRGTSIIAVNTSHKIVACSWMDGSIVNMLSNADSSGSTKIYRQIKQNKVEFCAPVVVREYNAAMQGVDRLDQLRARFSICDGHSFQKWHKKLALAFIDIARVNAYVTRKLAMDSEKKKQKSREEERDPHRFFMFQLIGDLLNGKWADAMDSEALLIGSTQDMRAPSTPAQVPISRKASPSPQFQCDAYSSTYVTTHLKKKSRDARECVICRHEGRKATQKTDYCQNHKVCLCKQLYMRHDEQNNGFYLQTSIDGPNYDYSWTCWDKFHRYYLPQGLFNVNGNIMKQSNMNKESKQLKIERIIKKKVEKQRLDREARAAALVVLPTLNEDECENEPTFLSLDSSFSSHASIEYY